MPKKKKGSFGKKARKGAAAFSTPSPRNAPKSGGARQQLYGRQVGTDLDYVNSAPREKNSSMQQLALNTRNKASHWDKGSRLRDQPITFVSGGYVEPLTDLELTGNVVPEKHQADLVSPGGIEDLQTNIKLDLQSTTAEPFFLDEYAVINESVNESNELQDTIDANSDSSDEIILFKGRGTPKPKQSALAETTVSVETRSFPEAISEAVTTAKSALQAKQTPIVAELSASPLTSPSPHQPDRLSLLVLDSNDEGGSDAAIDDYIANMEDDDIADMVKQLIVNRRTLGGNHNDIVVDSGSDREGDEDIEDDADANDGDGEDDGGIRPQRWYAKKGYSDEEVSESESDNLDDAWPLSEEVDDKELARLLTKQEELGLGSDELILFDEALAGPQAAKQANERGKQSKRSKASGSWKESMFSGRPKGFRASGNQYPSAEAVADAFEQLEILGKKDRFQFDLTDSELEATLEASWVKDRLRKKEKKKAREELRAQGLLGKNTTANDPRIKYPNGMELQDVKTEFQMFLLGSENSVALPPMDAQARKVIHELAYRFNITSKSIGSGLQRRPTLVRTKGTVRFEEDQFQAIFAKYRRRFFARLDGKRFNAGAHKTTAGRRGGGDAAVAIRNGEVVGGSAPEIGQANKGRTMLEKMGWSMGMALGAMDNKGMTQPIEHIVKRSKAGLG